MNGKPHEADKPRLIWHDDGSVTYVDKNGVEHHCVDAAGDMQPETFLEELARELFDEYQQSVAHCWMVFRTKAIAAQQDMREARVAFDREAALRAEMNTGDDIFMFELVHGRKPLNDDELQKWINSPEGEAALANDLNPYNGDGNQ